MLWWLNPQILRNNTQDMTLHYYGGAGAYHVFRNL